MLANQTIERKGEILKAVTEVKKKDVDNNKGKVSFENEVILLLVKNEYFVQMVGMEGFF